MEKLLANKIFSPKDIYLIGGDELRSCGISTAKILYIKGIAEILINQPNYLKQLTTKADNVILTELCKIKGVGIWTASIFAMSILGKDDIFPYNDSSIEKAINLIYGNELDIEKIISNELI